MPDGESIAAVLLPNGDVRKEDEPTYLLGSIKIASDEQDVSTPPPLIAEISISNIREPTVSCLQQLVWSVRVLPGQTREPIHGRTNGILLRVVRDSAGP